ncbi:hypothetical protein OD765_12590, partial [Pseudomonas aeruginosa]|nr:hypothetical protein [Pseudomonas aeruginosa]
MRLALRPLRRLSLAALATLGACSILPEAQVLQVYLLPVHNPPASAAAGGLDWSLRIARPSAWNACIRRSRSSDGAGSLQ